MQNFHPLSASCIRTSLAAQLAHGEAILHQPLNDFPLDAEDPIMPCHDAPITCNNPEEQFLVPTSNMSADDCSHNALPVETETANMNCSLDLLETWLDLTSPPNIDWEELLQLITPSGNTSPLASDSNICLASYFGMSSLPSVADNSSLFIESSPVFSNRHQYDSHPVDNMNNDVNNHLNVNMGINNDVTNSVCVSQSPSNVDGNVPTMSSMNAEIADDWSGDVASFSAALTSAQLCIVPPPPNLEAPAIHAQLNLDARPSPPLYTNLKPAHSMNERRAMKNSGDGEARAEVSFLVNSWTPAIDDGYRWCKYGQKNIKGQLHPRCYFKCAQPTCPVKKQTESSSSMVGHVLITYFGKHNH